MHNINFIRENATAFDNAMKQRGETPCSVKIIKIDEEKRNTQTILQNIFFQKKIKIMLNALIITGFGKII